MIVQEKINMLISFPLPDVTILWFHAVVFFQLFTFSFPSCLSVKCCSASRRTDKAVDIRLEEVRCAELICENFHWLNLFKVENKDARTFSMTIFQRLHCWPGTRIQCLLLFILSIYLFADTMFILIDLELLFTCRC